jgi:hypothetical protein
MMPNRSSPGPGHSPGLCHRLPARGPRLLAVAVLASVPLRANLRAPLRVDGFFSGSLRSLPVSEAVRLVREDLRLRLRPGANVLEISYS